MVFPSVPLYLDPPNWNQLHQAHHLSGGGERNEAGITIRPESSMAERTRLPKIPQPEHALRCPRCDSANTKFCYFNNYSLSQPRHFCKACRRYWTRGGALRNVPVGGGCRRNKRSKPGSSAARSTSSTSAASHHRIGATASGTRGPSLTASSHPIPGYGHLGMQSTDDDFRLQEQIQQFPTIMGGGTIGPLPPPVPLPRGAAPLPNLLYSSFGEGIVQAESKLEPPMQFGSAKMEANNAQGIGFPRSQYLVDHSKNSNDLFWGGWAAAATGFNSSSSADNFLDSFSFRSSSQR
ncbi:hypothetical protein Cni_G15663 [Canna indica]|uniref:Dof zinc finger protein n=1 Tax=Canna indica TaxID=4628 RepID=A0AAQ3QF44_9LILI|nr:hypothetical protein Cni_G15663 [Canna indica]